jgi:hypothetical protein
MTTARAVSKHQPAAIGGLPLKAYIVPAGVLLLVLGLLVTLFQPGAAELDVVRNHLPFFYKVFLLLRIAGYLAGIVVAYMVLARRGKGHHVKSLVAVCSAGALLILIGSIVYYHALIQQSNGDECLNQVGLNAVIGAYCYLPD